MIRLRLMPLFLLAFLAPAGSAQAQAVGSPALAGWTSGSPLDRRPIVTVRAYSSSAYYSGSYGSLAPAIFMTTLNTPGIYGAYSFGTGGITLTREPWFTAVYDDRETIPSTTITTLPLRRPTTPAGAPTLAAAPPSVVPAVPGSATVPTYPGQISPVATPPAAAPEDSILRTSPPPEVPPAPTASLSSEKSARVVVRVPEDARLEFEGVTMPQTGRIRSFVTPALLPGQRYHYDVRAVWQEDGRTVVHERKVNVYGGEKAEVDFLSPEENAERELHTRPILPAPVPGAPPRTAPRAAPRPAPGTPPRAAPETPPRVSPKVPQEPPTRTFPWIDPDTPPPVMPGTNPRGPLETPQGLPPDVSPETKPGKPPVVPPLRPTLPPNRG
jgi:uncharacterized protein (TIGR03000 family)